MPLHTKFATASLNTSANAHAHIHTTDRRKWHQQLPQDAAG